eukprot:1149859-Pelagomonas_calceolata.AAC.1
MAHTKPGQHLEAAQRHHAGHCKNISGTAVSAILLGVGGSCYSERTVDQFKYQALTTSKLASLDVSCHAHSVKFAHKLVTTKSATKDDNAPHRQVLELGASSNPPNPH